MLIIISGSSGVGKNTVINELIKRNENLKLLKTCTTRKFRSKDDNNIYINLSREAFDKKIKAGEFFEYEEIHKNFYGVLKKSLEEVISSSNTDYIKDIGVLGQINLKRELDDKVKILSVYLKAPKKALIERLKNRGEADIDLRLSRMEYELSYVNNYDIVINNIILDKTVKQIENFILKLKKKK